jgi:hypothetical protein
MVQFAPASVSVPAIPGTGGFRADEGGCWWGGVYGEAVI